MTAVTPDGRRSQPRKYLDQRCWIALEGFDSLVECLVEDISHTGARVIVETEKKMPPKFDLYLTANGTVGRKCQTMWQTANIVGVKFVGRSVPYRANEEAAEPIVVLE